MVLQQKARATRRAPWTLGVVAACLLAMSPVRNAMAGSPVVMTHDGPVKGLSTPTMREFLGIPYAAAPVDDLRWRPPQPHARWLAPRDATRFASHCAQNASPFGAASVSEDCLYLNVFTPNDGRDDHPVMVWIHAARWSSARATTTTPCGWSSKAMS